MSVTTEFQNLGESVSLSQENNWLPILQEAVRSIKFGSIQIKIHDSQVVLIERIEQKRFELSSKAARLKAKL